MMLRLPQNDPCKRATLLIVPGESCGLQTPAILTTRLLFHGRGDKSQRSCVWLDQGGLSSVAERSITFYIVLIMSDVSVGGGSLCMHSSQVMWYKARGSYGVSCLETDVSSDLSFIPPQTETARIYRVMWRSICWASFRSTKSKPSKH